MKIHVKLSENDPKGKELNEFSNGVKDELGNYVYILVDPRDNKPFYVGKGQGDRLFEHVKQKPEEKEKERYPDLKLDLIEEIEAAGEEVIHIIHRHGMDDKAALEVEAALIDIIDDGDLTNKVSGHGARRGPLTAQGIEDRYSKETMKPKGGHRLLFIKIKESTIKEHNNCVYNAVKGHWRLNYNRANNVHYILAIKDSICIGVFKHKKWYRSQQDGEDKRLGFCGEKIESGDDFDLYHKKRLPLGYQVEGARNPVRYYP